MSKLNKYEEWKKYYKYVLKCKRCHRLFGSDLKKFKTCPKCTKKPMGRRFGQKKQAIESFTV